MTGSADAGFGDSLASGGPDVSIVSMVSSRALYTSLLGPLIRMLRARELKHFFTWARGDHNGIASESGSQRFCTRGTPLPSGPPPS